MFFFLFKIYNNTTLPLVILNNSSTKKKIYHRISTNEHYYLPIYLLYEKEHSTISIGINE